MHFTIPDVIETLKRLMTVESTFDEITQPIHKWLSKYRIEIIENRNLIEKNPQESDITVLNIFLRDLLVRAIKGEMGSRVHEELMSTIKSKADLLTQNYRKVLKKAKY